MTAPLRMTKDEMRVGLQAGRRLVQEEWANPSEIKFVDELVFEGIAQTTPWEYRDGFQCERRVVTARADAHSKNPPEADEATHDR